MKLKIALTFLALSLCAAAQTVSNVSGVTLSGPGVDPTIENHTNKGIVAAFLIFPTTVGNREPVEQVFIASGEVPANGAMKLNSLNAREKKRFDASRKTTLNAVVFSDGELRGIESPDLLDFQQTVEKIFQSTKQAFDLAKSGNWDKVKAKAEAKGSDVAGKAAAWKMLNIHDAGGDVNQLANYAKLPQVIWKTQQQGGLLDRLWQMASAIFKPFEITAYAQSNAYSSTSIQPYPQGTDTGANNPTQWEYVCNTFPGSSYPCPGLAGETPFEGIAAFCTSGSGYNIAVQIDVAQDVQDSSEPVIFIAGAESFFNTNNGGTGTYKLLGSGDCYTQPGHGNEEWFNYSRTCDGGNPDELPTKVRDTTGNTCGDTALGYTS